MIESSPSVAFGESRPGSRNEHRALAALEREEQLEEQAQLGTAHPLAQRLLPLEEASRALNAKLDDYAARAGVRDRLADYLEQVVCSTFTDEKIARLPQRLRDARRKAWCQWRLVDGKIRLLWETKAGEPLLCPDDAREEAMRLKRRLEAQVGDLSRRGLRVYYGVLTMPNAPAGELRAGIDALWKRFNRMLDLREDERLAPSGARIAPRRKGCRRKDVPKRYPVEGAIAVLEAPLGRLRDWHPHLNVILVTRGRLDWEDWHAGWSFICDWRLLKPGNVEAAFRELIKYSVRAVPEKSEEKAQCSGQSRLSGSSPGSSSELSAFPGERARAMPPCRSSSSETPISGGDPMDGGLTKDSSRESGRSPRPLPGSPYTGLETQSRMTSEAPVIDSEGRSPSPSRNTAPAMIEWSRAEWIEWWGSMKGRRRTRTYGELYGIGKADQEEQGEWVTVGRAHREGAGFRSWYALLESIPGDKSLPASERLRRWRASLDTGPPEKTARLLSWFKDWHRIERLATMTA